MFPTQFRPFISKLGTVCIIRLPLSLAYNLCG